MNDIKFWSVLPRDVRYLPVYGGLFVLALLLLLFRDLSDEIRRYLVPSLGVYIVGASLICSFHFITGGRQITQASAAERQWTGISTWSWIGIAFAHVVWFLGFIVYNFWRAVL